MMVCVYLMSRENWFLGKENKSNFDQLPIQPNSTQFNPIQPNSTKFNPIQPNSTQFNSTQFNLIQIYQN